MAGVLDTNNLSFFEFTSASSGERILVSSGTATITDFFSDGIIFINRWTNGTTSGTADGVPFTFTMVNNQSFHNIFASFAVPVPVTGSAQYGLLASTDSTSTSGTGIGNGITSGTIAVNFLNATVGLNMNVDFNSTNYTVSGASPIAKVTIGSFSADVFGSGPGTFNTFGGGCGGGCGTNVQGFFAGGETTAFGSTPNRIGLVYGFFEPVLNVGIGGAGAFTLTDVSTTTIFDVNGFILFPDGFIDGALAAVLDTNNLSFFEFTSASSGERILVSSGTATITDNFSDGIIFMNRWTNGTTSGTADGVGFTFPLVDNQSIHNIFAGSAVPVPVTGSASYGFLASTDSTTSSGIGIGNGITSGTIGVDFLNATVGLNMNINHVATNYTVSGAAAIQNFTIGSFSADVFGSGPGTFNTVGGGCGSGCGTNVAGFFAGGETTAIGSTPNRIGLQYAFFEPVLNGGDGVGGAGAFTLTGVSP